MLLVSLHAYLFLAAQMIAHHEIPIGNSSSIASVPFGARRIVRTAHYAYRTLVLLQQRHITHAPAHPTEHVSSSLPSYLALTIMLSQACSSLVTPPVVDPSTSTAIEIAPQDFSRGQPPSLAIRVRYEWLSPEILPWFLAMFEPCFAPYSGCTTERDMRFPGPRHPHIGLVCL